MALATTSIDKIITAASNIVGSVSSAIVKIKDRLATEREQRTKQVIDWSSINMSSTSGNYLFIASMLLLIVAVIFIYYKQQKK